MPKNLSKRAAADPVVHGPAADLTFTERQALRDICEFADVLQLDGEAWLLLRASPAVLDILAAFEADDVVEDDILDTGELDDADREPSLGSVETYGHGRSFDQTGWACGGAEDLEGVDEDGADDERHWSAATHEANRAARREAQAMAEQAIGMRAGRSMIVDPDAIRRLGERAAVHAEAPR